jgi:hypothetical protein
MSHYHQPAPDGKDPELWEIAQKRASFRNHFITYVIINGFLWGIWFFTFDRGHAMDIEIGMPDFRHHYPWPIWTTLGWGIGVAFHFANAYIFPKSNAVEREYQKLKNQQNK